MEQYVIKPWDTRDDGQPAPVDWDMQVPPEVDAIAELVMKEYEMSVSSKTLITSKPDKGGAIWRIETDKGPRSLKVLHRTPERSLYSVGLQEYVVRQGARVPALIPARDGKLFVEKGGKLWIVTDWIALTQATKVDLAGAQELCFGLGEFHRHSKGYVPPQGAKNSSRLYRWPNYYQKIAKKIGWMREMAKAYRETTASNSILSVVDKYERQALDALERLKASAYPRMVQMGEPHWGVVHQDYGWSNGQNGPGGLWVIDLDGVAYDLPFRDLRKLITSTMDDMGVWDLTWMRGMIEAYHRANPLDRESFEVLLIDLAAPNEFYKHLKEMFYDPVTFLNTEAEAILQRILSTDQTKDQALAELAKDISQYQPGDYTQAAVPATTVRQAPASASDQANWQLASPNPAAKGESKPVDVEPGKLIRLPEKESKPVRTAVAAKKPPVKEERRVEAARESGKREKEKKKEKLPDVVLFPNPELPFAETTTPASRQSERLKPIVATVKKAGSKPVKKKAASTGSAKTASKTGKKTVLNKSSVAKKASAKLPAGKALKKTGKSNEKAKTGTQLAKRSSSPRGTQHAAVKHPYKKAAAPSRKLTSNQAKKPRAVKAKKTGRNMR
ncbi:CotS family spore coat protein [Brevibacillus agri]|uniref:CotS family spore coat protein n=1 Tax=Brevibacillus agri TaxID=51101 RepID=UPI002E1B2144|nr:CotS family spore coat protein [Brevibacillus agri]MED4573172.1 CotS family spore coat protein [Brevibacillus agri]